MTNRSPDLPVSDIADALVATAQAFRRNFRVPEASDDDRLVVVVDLQKARGSE
jgi:hypothetical protein